MLKQTLAIAAALLFIAWPMQSTPPGVNIGEKVPEIELPNPTGQKIKLSSLQGNLVLLSFWSTWCAACNSIKNPEYKILNENYKNSTFGSAKGFEIYSVAFDSVRDKWIRRIAEDNLNWENHVVDLDSYYSHLWWDFNIRSIPASYLLDENGRIIGVNMTFQQLERELAKRKTGEKQPQLPPIEGPTVPDDVIVDNGTQPTLPDNKPTDPTASPGDPKPGTEPGSGSTAGLGQGTSGVSPGSGTTGSSSGAGSNSNSNTGTIVLPPSGGTASTGGNSGTTTTPSQPIGITGDAYKIQLGVFRSPDLIKFNILQDLGNLETEMATSRLQRVLLGSYTKPGSATVLAKVKSRGFTDVFVVKRKAGSTLPGTGVTVPKPTPTPTQPTGVIADAGSGSSNSGSSSSSGTTTSILRMKYKVQLGVFRKAVLNNFRTLNHLGALNIERTPNGLEKVLLGSFDTKTSADITLSQARSMGYSDAFLVTREEYETVAVMSHSQTVSDQPGNAPALMALNYGELNKSMLGKQAPEVLLENYEGAAYPLSALRGKVTLVYLWATWSGPARDNHVDINKVYSKYKNENFAIYGVAFDKDKDRWKKVVAEDQLNWGIHVYEPAGMTSNLLERYNVEYLPAMFLVDENGKVVAENLSYEQLDAELNKRFVK